MGLNLRWIFRDGLSEEENKARLTRLMTDPEDGILCRVQKKGRPPEGFSFLEARDHLMGRRLSYGTPEDCARHWKALGYRSEYHMLDDMSRKGPAGAVNVSMFSTVTANLLFAIINKNSEEAYLSDPAIAVADSLVQDFEDNKVLTTVPEGIMQSAFGFVKEGEEFPFAQATDDYTTIGLQKMGEQMKVTAEAVQADDTGIVLAQAENIGRAGPGAVARFTIERCIDRAPSWPNSNSAYVYRPKAALAGQALYSASDRAGAKGGNLVTSNALATNANLAKDRVQLGVMSNKDTGVGQPKRRLGVQMKVILVPDALADTALKLVGQNLVYSVSDVNGAGVQYNALNRYYGLQVLATTILDETTSTGATDWWAGDPKKQFKRKYRRRFFVERMTSPAQSDEMFSNDIVMKIRTCVEVEIGAIDYRFFLKNTA